MKPTGKRDPQSITFLVLPEGGLQTAVGRAAWCLKELLAAGDRGITSMENPAPRLAAYVFKLRRLHGLLIETAHEEHRGPYPGNHARYRLHSEVKVLRESEARP